ncbi:MAG TPA: Spy/CpxP family protein refolding chaperone [Planctomycetota bacterium]|nr:Spy/CpxP family protein refolding chaperone [Planctomycetota bacterium]
MKTWVAVGAVLLSASTAFARQQDDPVERAVQRLKDQLTLTDEQVTKVREIVKKEREDVKSVLTDAQKTTYDQAGGPRGNRGNGGNNPGNGNGNFTGFRGSSWLPPTADLKTELSLTDEQVTKINEIRDALRQELRTFFQQNRRNNGVGQNLADQFNAFQEKSKEETSKKIREILTDEQKPKFDEALKAFAASQPAGFGNNRGTVDERVARIMENLKIDDGKESEAVKGLVKKVLEAMDKLDAFQRETRTKIDEVAKDKELSDAAVGEKIEALLKGHRDLEKDLAGARKALTEVVTNRQELELLRRGILR